MQHVLRGKPLHTTNQSIWPRRCSSICRKLRLTSTAQCPDVCCSRVAGIVLRNQIVQRKPLKYIYIYIISQSVMLYRQITNHPTGTTRNMWFIRIKHIKYKRNQRTKLWVNQNSVNTALIRINQHTTNTITQSTYHKYQRKTSATKVEFIRELQVWPSDITYQAAYISAVTILWQYF